MTEASEKKVPAVTSKKGTPVTPSDLLRITSQMTAEGAPTDKIAHACGYFTEATTTATGEADIRVTAADNSAFMLALLAAQGTVLTPPARSSRRSNRQPIIKIGKNGNIVVGSRYSVVAGFEFGENLDTRVRVEAEKGKITIFAADPADYASEDQDDSGLDDIDDIDEEESDLDL